MMRFASLIATCIVGAALSAQIPAAPELVTKRLYVGDLVSAPPLYSLDEREEFSGGEDALPKGKSDAEAPPGSTTTGACESEAAGSHERELTEEFDLYFHMPGEFLLPYLRKYFAEGDEDESRDFVASFATSASWLAIRATPSNVKAVERLLGRLRTLRPADIELEIQIVRCEPQAVLELLTNPAPLLDGMTDDQRQSFLDKASTSDSGVLVSQTVRCVDGLSTSILTQRLKVGSEGSWKHVLKVRPVAGPGGVVVRMSGAIDLPSAHAGSTGSDQARSRHSAVVMHTALAIPENRTCVVGVAGTSETEKTRSPLLLLVRARKGRAATHVDLGRGRHVFYVGDILRSCDFFPGPVIELRTPDEESVESAGGAGGAGFTFSEAAETREQRAPEDLVRLVKEGTGGDGVWGEQNMMEVHGGALWVVTPDAGLLRRIETALADLRTPEKYRAQLSCVWLALDRQGARALQAESGGRSELSAESLKRLLAWVGEGKAARVVDGVGASAYSGSESCVHSAEIVRGDALFDWVSRREEQGARQEGVMPQDGETRAVSCSYDLRGPLEEDDVNLGLLAQLGTVFEAAEGSPELLVACLADRLYVRNGATYLLNGGPLLSDGASGLYLLLNVAWRRLPEVPAEASEEAAGLEPWATADWHSEYMRSIATQDARVREILSTKTALLSMDEPVVLASFASRMADEGGVPILIEPDIDADEVKVKLKLGRLPISKCLDWMCLGAWLQWTVYRGNVVVSLREHLYRLPEADWIGPSEEDFTAEADKGTFRALCKEVALDLGRVTTTAGLFEAIAGATGTRYATAGAGDDFSDEWNATSFPPRGANVVPVLLLWELRQRVTWSIHEGVVVYSR